MSCSPEDENFCTSVVFRLLCPRLKLKLHRPLDPNNTSTFSVTYPKKLLHIYLTMYQRNMLQFNTGVQFVSEKKFKNAFNDVLGDSRDTH